MLQKLKNRPLWYKIWAISVGICAVYFLIRVFTTEPTQVDRFINLYALTSILLDYFIFPKEVSKTNPS